ncbi:ribonuclease H-like domain-containing protein [candidate division WOR-3 bacterium]|nr:ribonuclease H-like domain-containing protein [candidate division WOR-3 bacterium]
MLLNSFCHLDGINLITEHELWNKGIKSWEQANSSLESIGFSEKKCKNIRKGIETSFQKFEERATDYFFDSLPREQHWRFFKEFKDEIAYLDIETTGLSRTDSVTVASIYYKGKLDVYVNGINMEKMVQDIAKPKILVTFNGNRFDIPFIENYFDIKIYQKKIDLMYILRNLGFRGGLKRCEKSLGITREGMENLDGNIAVLLWEDYRRNKNVKALKTLIAYNAYDTINLERLSAISYNKNIILTGIDFTKMDIPRSKAVPFFPNPATVKKIMDN